MILILVHSQCNNLLKSNFCKSAEDSGIQVTLTSYKDVENILHNFERLKVQWNESHLNSIHLSEE